MKLSIWEISVYALFLVVAAAVITGCTTVPVTPPGAPTTGSCATVAETIVLQNQTVHLPQAGKFVLESHLATTADTFPAGRAFPSTSTEGIQAHLVRACELNGRCPGAATFYKGDAAVWTPPEGGKAGQGSVGDLKPSPQEEMWSGNMFWTASTKPKPGTRFIASVNGKSVVVVMGYETGPRDAKYLGGLQQEVMAALGATDATPITIARALDQTLTPGPVVCK